MTIAATKPSSGIQDTITINSGTTINTWLAGIKTNLVQTSAGSLQFTLKNTDSDSKLTFTPHYQRYLDRYGIYFTLAGTTGATVSTPPCPTSTGGTGGAAGSSGGSVGSGGTTTSSGGESGSAETGGASGCSCSLEDSGSSAPRMIGFLFVAGLLIRRRKRSPTRD